MSTQPPYSSGDDQQGTNGYGGSQGGESHDPYANPYAQNPYEQGQSAQGGYGSGAYGSTGQQGGAPYGSTGAYGEPYGGQPGQPTGDPYAAYSAQAGQQGQTQPGQQSQGQPYGQPPYGQAPYPGSQPGYPPRPRESAGALSSVFDLDFGSDKHGRIARSGYGIVAIATVLATLHSLVLGIVVSVQLFRAGGGLSYLGTGGGAILFGVYLLMATIIGSIVVGFAILVAARALFATYARVHRED